jgi:hypothetical protein
MSAANIQYFTFVNGVGRELQNSKNQEPIFLTVSVSSDGTDQGTKITCVSGKFDFNGKVLSNAAAGTGTGQVLIWDQIGANSGVAGLDSGGKIPLGQLPASLMEYKGTWNATTNSPSLADGTGVSGYFYRVQTAGTQNLGSGSQTFIVGDWVMYNGAVWQLAHAGADAVVSVNGQSGVVSLTTDNVPEGSTNLYYTAARFNTAFSGKSTTDLAEGANLYFTGARAVTAVVVSTVTSGDTTHAPSGDAVFNAIAAATPTPAVSLTNNQGSTVTVRQCAFMDAFGSAKLLGAGVAGVTPDTLFLLVKDASIANTVAGNYYLPGQVVSGFSGGSFTVGLPVYASKATPGSFQQDQTGMGTGDNVISLGVATSATALLFNPQFLYQIGS